MAERSKASASKTDDRKVAKVRILPSPPVVKVMDRCLSGLRGWIANPLFAGSNPALFSNFGELREWSNRAAWKADGRSNAARRFEPFTHRQVSL